MFFEEFIFRKPLHVMVFLQVISFVQMSLWTLAFKNDVSFFRGREAYQGLSSRSLATDALYASGLGFSSSSSHRSSSSSSTFTTSTTSVASSYCRSACRPLEEPLKSLEKPRTAAWNLWKYVRFGLK